MKSQTKQSAKVGGLVTREVHLGADGPLTVHLKDNIILVNESGVSMEVPASCIAKVLTPCECHAAIGELTAEIRELQDEITEMKKPAVKPAEVTNSTNTVNTVIVVNEHLEPVTVQDPTPEVPLAESIIPVPATPLEVITVPVVPLEVISDSITVPVVPEVQAPVSEKIIDKPRERGRGKRE